MADFYNGARLLSLRDLNGERPEIYMCTSNRSAGKTTYFLKLCVSKFIKKKEKFAVLYRFNYELDNCAEKIFRDIKNLFFPAYDMTSKRKASGIFHELYLNGVNCGYAISLNSSDQLKKYSHFFSDVKRIFFDEFQSENNHYCPNEVQKFISIHTSIARGNGEQVRYVPVYMCSNPVSILNPYYISTGISSQLSTATKFLRGNGFVLEQNLNETAAQAQADSAFNRAFSSERYTAYNSQFIYLSDNEAFISTPTGRSKYLCTIKYKSKDYAIRFFDGNILYCDDRPDQSHKIKIAVTTDDHNINYVLLRENTIFLDNMRYYFDKGAFRFKNLQCKEAILSALSY